jgi:6-phosphofructokinase 1
VALQEEDGKTVIRLVPLANVAGKTRHMPDDYLKADENQLSETGLAYFERLLPRKFKVGRPFV